jgi:hypothetical protein
MCLKEGFSFIRITVRGFWYCTVVQKFTKRKAILYPPDGMMGPQVLLGL